MEYGRAVSGLVIEVTFYHPEGKKLEIRGEGLGVGRRRPPQKRSMSEGPPAESLLARVAQQDVAALSELYDRYAPRAYGLVAHILSSHSDAEEILQEVFARLWSESTSLTQERGSVVAWLVVTARAAALVRLRAQRMDAASEAPQRPITDAEKGAPAQIRKSRPLTFAQSVAKSPGGKSAALKPSMVVGAIASGVGPLSAAWLPEPKEIAMIDDRLALLHKVLNQLPKPQRQALELAVFRGLGESEIAAEMGEPLGKVRSSLRAAVTFVKHRRRAVCGTWAANI